MRVAWLIFVLLWTLAGCSNSGPATAKAVPQGRPAGQGAAETASSAGQADGVTVSVVKAEIGTITWETPPKNPLPEYLKVWVKTTTTRRIRFSSWSMTEVPSETYVVDDLGKKYPIEREQGAEYRGTSEYVGTNGALGLKANESVTALLIFAPPQPGATRLTLHLGGKNVEAGQDFTLAINSWK